jgi:hypothetical protein
MVILQKMSSSKSGYTQHVNRCAPEIVSDSSDSVNHQNSNEI